jgi:hypothetical protein
LKAFSSCVDGALDDSLIIFREHFILIQDHGACPRAVIDGKVKDPFVSGCLTNFHEELFKIRLIAKGVLVEGGHLSHGNDFAALTEEVRNSNVVCEGMEGVQVALDGLVAPLLVKLFEVLPITLEWSLQLSHII